MSQRPRKPAAFRPDQSTVILDEPVEVASPVFAEQPDVETGSTPAPAIADLLPAARKGLRWGKLLAAALSILLSAAIALAINDLIDDLYTRHLWLGRAGLAFLAVAVFAALMICLKELVALSRLRRLEHLRQMADRALRHETAEDARTVITGLKNLYRNRRDMTWPLERLGEHDRDVIDPSAHINLAERTLMADLDMKARSIISGYSKRVSLVTAVNPAAILDIAFIAAQNLAMLRRLATLYGSRPGTVGTLKLARMVLGHLVVSGGLALGDNLIQHVLGKGIAGRLSARIGEGAINGIMTARIGIAALDLCRPLPFSVLERPGLKSLLTGAVLGDDTQQSKMN